jgi:hypothetical protein
MTVDRDLVRDKPTASGRATHIAHFAWPEKLNREDLKDLKENTSRSLRSSWFKSPWYAPLCGASQSHAFQAWSITETYDIIDLPQNKPRSDASGFYIILDDFPADRCYPHATQERTS